jgi:hypothetical protein
MTIIQRIRDRKFLEKLQEEIEKLEYEETERLLEEYRKKKIQQELDKEKRDFLFK